MIGIIGAMKIEVAALKEKMTGKEEIKIGSTLFVRGELCGREVVVAECGIGKVAAAVCAQSMIMRFSPDCIINSGVAGSLSAEAGICDTIVADSLVQHDLDTTPLGDPPGFISGLDIVEIPADKKVAECLVKAAQGGKGKVITGRIASGDQFIASREKKDFIVETFGAVACEMEGAAIAHTCCLSGVKFGILRAISDCADGSAHMDYAEFLPVAAEGAANAIMNFVKDYDCAG